MKSNTKKILALVVTIVLVVFSIYLLVKYIQRADRERQELLKSINEVENNTMRGIDTLKLQIGNLYFPIIQMDSAIFEINEKVTEAGELNNRVFSEQKRREYQFRIEEARRLSDRDWET
jgi:hypothetical protein